MKLKLNRFLITLILLIGISNISHSQTLWHLEKADEGIYSSNAYLKINPDGLGNFIVENCQIPLRWYCTPNHIIFQDTLTKIYYIAKVKRVNDDKMILTVDNHKLIYELWKKELTLSN